MSTRRGLLCDTTDSGVLIHEVRASSDATLFDNDGNMAGSMENFLVGSTPNGIRRALLKFDAKANIEEPDDWVWPVDAEIVCVEIGLSLLGDSKMTSAMQVSLHRVTSDWNTTGTTSMQGVNGAAAQTGDATWTYAKYKSVPWNTPGGDFDPLVLSTEMVDDGKHWFGSRPALHVVVQEWLNGNAPNFGLLLKSTQESVSEYRIYQGIENSPQFVPRLIVTYTSPSNNYPHKQPQENITPNPTTSTTTQYRGGLGLAGLLVAAAGWVVAVILVYGVLFFISTKIRPKSRTSTPNHTVGTQQDVSAVSEIKEVA